MIEGEQITWIDLTEHQSQERWDHDEASSPTHIGVNGKSTDKDHHWEYEKTSPKNSCSIALLVSDFDIGLNLFAHRFILLRPYTLA
jgi:hypothetical protein